MRDHPALSAAARESERIVPLFVFDDRILRGDFACPNRVAFMLDSLADLDRSLKQRGAPLVVRRGDVIEETMRVADQARAEVVHMSEDHSSYATRRETALHVACRSNRRRLVEHPGVTVVPPGEVVPAGGDHYRVFTPYWRQWRQAPRRALLGAPRSLKLPSGLRAGGLPKLGELVKGETSPALAPGGEDEARRRLTRWLRSGIEDYEALHDDLAADGTSRLSAYLRFGCLSPLEVAERAGNEAFVRQLCWRDFHHQVLAAFPRLPREDYRPRGHRWSRNRRRLNAWKQGRTGYPIVDAGMRQLQREGFMHNRARLITASFLVKDLRIDWRTGARHFWDLLADGEIANNAGNWQWVAGTGNDTRPNRTFNPIRQALRFDPDGDYVRRYVPELETIEGRAVHQPWKLDASQRRKLDYPEPIVGEPSELP